MNWFALALVVLQFCGSIQYYVQGKMDMGHLWLLYALANIVLIKMGMSK